MLFFLFSQINWHRSFRSPRASSQDYFNFSLDLSMWLYLDQNLQWELKMCLKLRKNEHTEPPFKPPPLDLDLINVSADSKEETCKPSCPNHLNCFSNLECKVEKYVIEHFDPNSSDHYDPLDQDDKQLEVKDHHSTSKEIELLTSNNPSFVLDFDEKVL